MKIALALAGVLAAFPAAAKKGGDGRGRAHRETSTAVAVQVRFPDAEVRIIRGHYAAHPVHLPPGLRKKLARGGGLPPGWQKRLQPFPDHLDARLGPLCGHCGRGIVDGCAVIYDKRTRIILDILQLAGDIAR
ncbi:MAG: hypothetical protein FJW37_00605 [Acidobacteria bacterium]|nr:hypothetical protein [Acidobacteriota bacterium]